MKRHKPWALLLLVLGACNEAPHTPLAPGAKLRATTVAVEQRVVPSGPATAEDPLVGCDDVMLDQAIDSDRFRVAVCVADTGHELRFVRQAAQATQINVLGVDDIDYEAVVDVTAHLWDKHLLTLDFAQERDGRVVIANWDGARFVVSSAAYHTADEESLGLDYRDGAFLLTTALNGQQRLLEVPVGEDKGKFRVEAVSCKLNADGKFPQALDLTVNTDGRVVALSYLGVTPAAEGSTSCSIDADRADDQTAWVDDGRKTSIAFYGDANAAATRIRIHSEGGGSYTVDFEGSTSPFCGQSSLMARRIKLMAGQRACQAVELAH